MNKKHKEFFQKLSELFKNYNATVEAEMGHLLFNLDSEEYTIPMFQSVVDEDYDALVYNINAGRYFNFMEQKDDNIKK